MTKVQMLDKLVCNNNGYLVVADGIDLGISKSYVLEYAHKNTMEKVARGIYITKDTWCDDMYVIHLNNKGIIFSHESALAMYGMIENEPTSINITVNRSYNASHLRKKGCKVYTVSPELYNLGVAETETLYGNKVPAYDMERTLCDIIKHKNDIEIQNYRSVVREYMQSKQKNLLNLMRYAKALGVEKRVRTYTEVML